MPIDIYSRFLVRLFLTYFIDGIHLKTLRLKMAISLGKRVYSRHEEVETIFNLIGASFCNPLPTIPNSCCLLIHLLMYFDSLYFASKHSRVRTGLKGIWIYRTVLKSLKIKFALKSTWKTLKGLEKSLNFTIYRRIQQCFWYLNQYRIVVPLFGAAYAAPHKGTTILY